MKEVYFIFGLPKSGTALLTSVLKQNTKLHIEENSYLSNIIANLASNWTEIKDTEKKKNVYKGIVDGFYKSAEQNIIFDSSNQWPSLIKVMNEVQSSPIKILNLVRNPAEIISVFEKEYRENPFALSFSGNQISTIHMRNQTLLMSDGLVGSSLMALENAVTTGYQKQMLFVDYNNFCNEPSSQMKRITEFFNLPKYSYDFKNINYKNKIVSLQPELLNCIDLIGLNNYQQYSQTTFWDAWI
jgi:sulfotransferase